MPTIDGEVTQVLTTIAMRGWLQGARLRDSAIYFIGVNLAKSRRDSSRVNSLAALCSALSDVGILTLSQKRIGWKDVSVYIGTTRVSTPANHPLCEGSIDPMTWMALKALDDRDPDISAARAVRDKLGCTDPEAVRVVLELEKNGLIDRIQGERGSFAPATVLTEKAIMKLKPHRG